jgi:histidinol phosphatase-like PHP family hydrolase
MFEPTKTEEYFIITNPDDEESYAFTSMDELREYIQDDPESYADWTIIKGVEVGTVKTGSFQLLDKNGKEL